MDQGEDHGTDDASIKPVSSLRSHFEALKSTNKSKHETLPRDATRQTTSLETPRSPFPLRASVELARPSSPWSREGEKRQQVEKSLDVQKGRESPPKPSHKKTASMQTPIQQPPAVKVDSPRSPPSTFFQRSSSRSPERLDNSPFGKVRELIAQRSGQSTTRSSTPASDFNFLSGRINGTETSRNVTRESSPARQPPPINRADKPKIPAKPPAISRNAGGSLTPEPMVRRPSADARISPFSTPPSSGENSPRESPPVVPPVGPSPFSPADTLTSLESETPDSPDFPPDVRGQESETTGPRQFIDPRLMGFTAVRSVPERRDPRSLGFEGPQHKSEATPVVASRTNDGHVRPPVRDPRELGFSDISGKSTPVDPVPGKLIRANTAVENNKQKDARNFGFSTANTPQNQTMSQSVSANKERSLPPPMQQGTKTPASTVRDPRQYGFSGQPSAGLTTYEEPRPMLPTRRLPQEAPPRPSDTSKPVMNQSGRSGPPSTLEKPPRVERDPAAQGAVPPTKDLRYPPPPKRTTFNEEYDSSYEPSIRPVQRSATIASVQSQKLPEAEGYDGPEQAQSISTARADYPDATQANRRPPFSLEGAYEIHARGDPKVFDVCGRYVCVSGYATRVFDMQTGDQIMAVGHGENVKVTAAKFKPGRSLDDEGKRIWLGNNIGELQEIDVETQTIMAQNSGHNRREIIRILRYRRNLITLDDDGKLLIWKADQNGVPNLKQNFILQKVSRGHTFSIMIQEKLWFAFGKEIRIYKPDSESQFNTLNKTLSQPSTGDVTSGTYSTEKGGRVYFGHSDGKVSIYSTTDYSCSGIVKISDYKITSLSFVGNNLWTAYKTGKVYVYDTTTTPWNVKKDWRAHRGPIHNIVLDPSSVWQLRRLQVVTAGYDDHIRMWDATLEEDWIEHAMQKRDINYCTFRELKVAVITWNVGAIVPAMLRDDFIADAIHAHDPPDLVVFGFQEVVDLEDRAVTAKSLLGFAKKKETAKPDQQHQSRVYREWRDYLARVLSRFTDAKCSYSELHMSSLIGLFQCVFVRQDEHRNVSMLSATSIKCGMGGHYGNKGALVTRFVVDDSSICFTNCHLAAGQTQTSHRNNDIATILESESLAAESNRQIRSSLFVGGGDGTQILDHEICILNGDLNYRIDTIPRDTVVKMIRSNDFSKLLERDQLLVSRRRVTGFRLAAFSELPLTFAPTYKYDPGTDNYDSSEKKRSPAWCDRVLYRGPGRIKQTEYRRHEVRVSDHRPVSGIFMIRIKKINTEKRDKTMDECYELFRVAKKELAEAVCTRWLVDVMGLADSEARRLLLG